MELEKVIGQIKKNWLILIIFILALSVRLIAIENKTSLHWDAPFSITASTPNNLSPEGYIFKENWDKYNFAYEKTYNAKELKKALFANDASPKSILKDIKTLRETQIDKQHTNLYYSILRIWNAGISGTDYKEIIKRDCSLNIIFFCFSFFFLYKLLNLIKNDTKFVATGLLFATVCTGSISQTILIREYALMETFFILITYIFVVLYKKIIDQSINTLNKKEIILYSITCSLFLLTGYYAIIYAIMLFVCLSFLCLIHKKNNLLKNIIFVVIYSFLLTILIFPNYFLNMFLMNEYANSINFSYNTNLIYCINKYITYTPIIVLTIFICLYPFITNFLSIQNTTEQPLLNKKETSISVILITIAILWCIYISMLLPPHLQEQGNMIRFISPATFGIAILIPTIIFSQNLNKIQKIITNILICYFICLSIMPLTKENTTDIRNMNDTSSYFKPIKKLDVPIVIQSNNWSLINYILYLDDDTKVRFKKEQPTETNYIFPQYLLFTDKIIKNYKTLQVSQSFCIYIQAINVWNSYYQNAPSESI